MYQRWKVQYGGLACKPLWQSGHAGVHEPLRIVRHSRQHLIQHRQQAALRFTINRNPDGAEMGCVHCSSQPSWWNQTCGPWRDLLQMQQTGHRVRPHPSRRLRCNSLLGVHIISLQFDATFRRRVVAQGGLQCGWPGLHSSRAAREQHKSSSINLPVGTQLSWLYWDRQRTET